MADVDTAPTVDLNETQPQAEDDDDLGFDPTKKKKKKRAKKAGFNPDGDEVAAPVSAAEGGAEATSESAAEGSATGSWTESDRDYSYTELLNRIYDAIIADKGGIDGGKGKKSIEPPEIGKIGTKKVAWANFVSNCRSISRKPEHVVEFVLTELGTTGSLDGQNKFVIKGRYSSKQLESVLAKYIKEYVACSTCRFLNTELKRENRILFKVCKDCGASSSVSSIRQGFRVQTKRKKV
jgi:translation initiation factor 2 subunit 2